MKVSLKSIAAELNLSKTTVSWVLQGKGDKKKISAKTQALVMAYAKKKKYSPNLLAKSLSVGVSNTLGLIIPSIEDTFYSQLAQSIESEAEKHDCLLMFCSSARDQSREDKLVQTLTDRRVDGIIIAPTDQQSSVVEYLVEQSFPLVVIDLLFEGFMANSVIIDNEMAGFQLVKHLLKRGAKKIAFFATATHLNAIKLRHSGYIRAHNQVQCVVETNLYKDIDLENYAVGVKEAMDQVYESYPDIDGFFFSTHFLANEGLNYLKINNKQINELHLASIHEMPHFKAFAPKMNIARLPIEALSSEVVRVLMAQINKTDLVKKIHVIPVELCIRDSD